MEMTGFISGYQYGTYSLGGKPLFGSSFTELKIMRHEKLGIQPLTYMTEMTVPYLYSTACLESIAKLSCLKI